MRIFSLFLLLFITSTIGCKKNNEVAPTPTSIQSGTIDLPNIIQPQDISVSNFTQTVQVSANKDFTLSDSKIITAYNTKLDKLIYVGIPTPQGILKNGRISAETKINLNATETATYLTMRSMPWAFDFNDPAGLAYLKNNVKKMNEVGILSKKIQEVVDKKGYLDFNDIINEENNSIEAFKNKIGINQINNLPPTTISNPPTTTPLDGSFQVGYKTAYKGIFFKINQQESKQFDNGNVALKMSVFSERPVMYGVVKAKKGSADNYLFTNPDEIYYTKPMLPSDFLSQSIKGTTGLDWENKEFSFDYLKEYWGTWSKILNGQEVTWDKKETDLGEISVTCESTDFIVLGVAQDVRVAVANAGSAFLSTTAFISSDNLFKSNVMKIVTDEILNNRDNQIEITNAYKNSVASKDWKPFIRLVIEKMQDVIKGELFQKALRETIIGIDMKNFIRFCSDLNKALDKVSTGYKVLDFFAVHFSFALAAMDKATVFPISGMKCQTPIPTNGLVAYYPFNGNANDESGNKNNGVVNQGVALTTDRKSNKDKAYSFGGVDKIGYIKVANSAVMTLNKTLSVSLWYKLNSYYGMDGWGNPNQNGYHVMIGKEGDRDGFYMGVGNDATTKKQNVNFNNNIGFNSNFSIVGNPLGTNLENLNKWVHAVTVIDGTNAKLYINGTLIKTMAVAPNFSSSNSKNLYIGTMWALSDTWYPFNGSIDDIRIYNRGLSDTEILALSKE